MNDKNIIEVPIFIFKSWMAELNYRIAIRLPIPDKTGWGVEAYKNMITDMRTMWENQGHTKEEYKDFVDRFYPGEYL